MSRVKILNFLAAASLLTAVVACSPEVGSDKWCEDLKEKPKKNWSTSEAADYAKHCVFK